jgi:hypothetical protein
MRTALNRRFLKVAKGVKRKKKVDWTIVGYFFHADHKINVFKYGL